MSLTTRLAGHITDRPPGRPRHRSVTPGLQVLLHLVEPAKDPDALHHGPSVRILSSYRERDRCRNDLASRLSLLDVAEVAEPPHENGDVQPRVLCHDFGP